MRVCEQAKDKDWKMSKNRTAGKKQESINGIKDKTKGIIFILLAAFFFSTMSVFVRLSGDVPTMQKAFFRNIVAAVVAVIILLRSGGPVTVRKKSLPALFLRSAFGTVGILANFWAVDHLDIADANMLNKLSPFFAILMSIFILGEKPNRIEWISVAFAFIGAAFVAKPSSGIISLPALVGILGGFAAGTAYTYVRKAGLQGVRGPIVVAFFSTFSTLVLLPNLLMNFTPMSARQFILLILAGCAAAGGQLSVTAAYQHAPARDISVFDYSQIIYAAFFGFLLFGEIPDVWSVIGYVMQVKCGWDEYRPYKNRSAAFAYSVLAKMPVKTLRSLRRRLTQWLTAEGAGYSVSPGGKYGKKELFPADWFANAKTAEFEGRACTVPVKSGDFLRQHYGDYETPPDENGKAQMHTGCRRLQ